MIFMAFQPNKMKVFNFFYKINIWCPRKLLLQASIASFEWVLSNFIIDLHPQLSTKDDFIMNHFGTQKYFIHKILYEN